MFDNTQIYNYSYFQTVKNGNVPSVKCPQANSEEYFASLLPYALYDGGVVVYKPCHIECVGSGGLWNTFLAAVNTILSSLLCASITQYI